MEGVPKLARVFAGVSYALIGVETAYDLYQLDVMYADGMLNKQQYNLHYDAAMGKSVFNTGVTTAGFLSTPLGGAVIGGTQTGATALYYDPALAAGQLWAILRVGEMQLTDGTNIAGYQMLWMQLMD